MDASAASRAMDNVAKELDVVKFGGHLLDSEDLDPIYCALHALRLDNEQLSRWLTAYWCYYDAGVASYLSELPNERFWEEMMRAAVNEEPAPTGGRWPRGSERRHFRGKSGIRGVGGLRGRYPNPEDFVCMLARSGPSYAGVRRAVKQHYMFGDWIAFKIGDMLERVYGVHVEFDNADVFMFDTPTLGADLVWNRYLRSTIRGTLYLAPHEDGYQKATVKAAVQYLLEQFDGRLAPPDYQRPINLQEVETILCKWKSHLEGHYPLNNDIYEIRKGLEPWTEHSQTAKSFLEDMPAPLVRTMDW